MVIEEPENGIHPANQHLQEPRAVRREACLELLQTAPSFFAGRGGRLFEQCLGVGHRFRHCRFRKVREGPVKQLASWQSFTDDLREVLGIGH
jgi:hypothetical protein